MKIDKRSRDILLRLEALHGISQADALQRAHSVLADGISTWDEAVAVIEFNRRAGAEGPNWTRRFIETMTAFLLGPASASPIKGPTTGHISSDAADWLIHTAFGEDSPPRANECDMLVILCERARQMPNRLYRFTLSSVSDAIIEAGQADRATVDQISRLLAASAGGEGRWISRFEARTLVAINDAIGSARNDPAWADLFARALANSLVSAAHPSPEALGAVFDRQTWLTQQARSRARVLGPHLAADAGWFSTLTADSGRVALAQAALAQAASPSPSTAPVSGGPSAQGGPASTQPVWLMRRLGWSAETGTTASPAERALVSLLDRDFPGFAQGLAALS